MLQTEASTFPAMGVIYQIATGYITHVALLLPPSCFYQSPHLYSSFSFSLFREE